MSEYLAREVREACDACDARSGAFTMNNAKEYETNTHLSIVILVKQTKKFLRK